MLYTGLAEGTSNLRNHLDMQVGMLKCRTPAWNRLVPALPWPHLLVVLGSKVLTSPL